MEDSEVEGVGEPLLHLVLVEEVEEEEPFPPLDLVQLVASPTALPPGPHHISLLLRFSFHLPL